MKSLHMVIWTITQLLVVRVRKYNFMYSFQSYLTSNNLNTTYCSKCLFLACTCLYTDNYIKIGVSKFVNIKTKQTISIMIVNHGNKLIWEVNFNTLSIYTFQSKHNIISVDNNRACEIDPGHFDNFNDNQINDSRIATCMYR